MKNRRGVTGSSAATLPVEADKEASLEVVEWLKWRFIAALLTLGSGLPVWKGKGIADCRPAPGSFLGTAEAN